jgi:predicted metal-dependent peptidase
MGVAAQLDGRITLCYNPELIERTSEEEILKVLSHEGIHLINKHLARLLRIMAEEPNVAKQKSKMAIYNIASDICANEQANIRAPITIDGVPWPPHTAERYKLPSGQIAEWYYLKFLEQLKDGMGKNKEGQKGEGDGDGEGKFGSPGFDDHQGWVAEARRAPDKMTLSRKVEQNISDIVREASKKYIKDKGSLPSGLAELIQGSLEPPRAPYYQIIKKYVTASRKSKFKRAYTRINRKRVFAFTMGHNNIPVVCPFPGKKRDRSFVIAILKDTSGSMSVEEILESLSGVKHIVEKDRYCKTYVVDCDAKVQHHYEVKRLSDIQMSAHGRGGTCLVPGLKFAKETYDPDVALIFTDGGLFDRPNDEDPRYLPKKMIWAVTRNGPVEAFNKRGFIVKLPYESKRRR